MIDVALRCFRNDWRACVGRYIYTVRFTLYYDVPAPLLVYLLFFPEYH